MVKATCLIPGTALGSRFWSKDDFFLTLAPNGSTTTLWDYLIAEVTTRMMGNWAATMTAADRIKTMDRPSPPQFSIRRALVATGLIACELGLMRWCGDDYLAVVVAVTVLPF